jgi:CBS domain-containing protein
MSLKIEELMVKPVITLSVASSVKEAVEIMSKYGIGCLVVLYDEMPTGIITEKDMLGRVLLAARDPLTTKLSQIMSAPIIFGEPKMSVQDAVTLMTEKKIKHLPIIENGRLVGLVTITDLIRSKAYLEHIFSSLSANVST